MTTLEILENYCDYFWTCPFPSPCPFKLKINFSARFRKDRYLANRFRLAGYLIFWNTDDLSWKLSHAQMWGSGSWGARITKILFQAHRYRIQSCITYQKNLSSRWIRSRDMRIFLLFDLEKRTVPPLPLCQIKLGSWNSVCELGAGHRCVFGRFRLFRPINSYYSPEMWLFGRWFLYFEFVSCITPLEIEPGNLNFVYTFFKGSRHGFWNFDF